MTSVAAILGLLLTGCTAFYKPPYVVAPPQEPETYLKEWKVVPGFSGYEFVVGLPIFEWVPVVGPYIAEMIQLRAGVRQDVIVPVMEESTYEHEARLAAASRRSGMRFFPDRLRHEAGCQGVRQR